MASAISDRSGFEYVCIVSTEVISETGWAVDFGGYDTTLPPSNSQMNGCHTPPAIGLYGKLSPQW